MQRVLLLAVCLACVPSLSGCVIPYAYPKLDFTRSLQLAASPTEVHVFRVDVAQAKSGSPAIYGWEQLTEVPVQDSGRVSPQIKSSLPHGVYLFMGALNYDFGTSSALVLRAYRPGFELLEVKSMERTDQLAWIPAAELAAQERALDALFPLAEGAEFQASKRVVHPGSISAAHREALHFGAAEYERLATSTDSQDDRAGLRKKAERLRERAEE